MRGSRRTRSRAIGVLALAVALAVLGAAACGGGQDFAKTGTTPTRAPGPTATRPPATRRVASTTTVAPVRDRGLQARLRAAVDRTGASRTAQTSISVTVTGVLDRQYGSAALDVAGTGVVDLRSGASAFTLSVPRFDRITGGGTIVQHTVNGVSYLHLPPVVIRAGGLPPSVSWLRLDPRTALPADASALVQAQVDPAGQLAFLSLVSDNVRTVGVEAVRGVRTTHYAGTVDVPTRASLPAPTSAARLASIEHVIGPARLTVDAWLDGAGRVRRVVVAVPLSRAVLGAGSAPGATALMKIQADLYTFGVPVSVAVPPQSQVRPYAALRLAGVSG